VKHRHRLAQAQRRKPSSRNKSFEVDEASDEQPSSGVAKVKKSSMLHMKAEGGRTKHRLDKFRRGGRSRNTYDNGGPAGSSAASTKNADDPGGELATANRERKGPLGRMQDELLGPRPAYKNGGRPKHRGYDVGGAAPSIFNPPTQQDLTTTPKQNYVASLVKNAGKNMAASGAAALASLQKNAPSFPGAPKIPVPGIKQGGRVKRWTAR
jgi:hypothetical protein